MLSLGRISINNSPYGVLGPWGAGWRDRAFGGLRELCAPVFHQRFTADVFCECLPKLMNEVEDGEAEKKLAKAIEKFVQEWDDVHAQDDQYPTKDGDYPDPEQMAAFYLEWREVEAHRAA
jgi:hypothetical protein